MKIISSSFMIVMNGVVHFRPFARYVVPNEQAAAMQENIKVDWRISDTPSYEKRYGGQNANGKHILISRYHGMGDHLMVTALAHYIKHLYPDARIHFYCDEKYSSEVWHGNPDVDGNTFLPLPIPLDAFKQYDYHILLDGMAECNAEHDQQCWYDDIFQFAGFDPAKIPDEFKRPTIQELDSDYKWVQDNEFDTDQKYLVYNLTSSSPIRDYPWELGRKFIHLFLDKHPDYKVVVIGQDDSIGSIPDERVIWLVDRVPDVRSHIPIIKNAKIVVCPDTGFGHLAAVWPQGPSVVSLWGPFTWQARVKYYSNHYPVTAPKSACPCMPCWIHGMKAPEEMCRHAKGYNENTPYCTAMEAITPEMILDKIDSEIMPVAESVPSATVKE